jgi:hypothetical protein
MSDDPISESAKAAQEVAKTTGKVIDVGRGLGGWLDRMFGEAIEQEVGRIWTVPATERRIAAAIYSWERLEVLLNKAKNNLHRRGVIRFRVPPPKVILPLLENATMEDNDDLHSLWAQLLATALDAAADEVHRKFVSILIDLTSGDARILCTLWKQWQVADKKKDTRDSTLTYGPGVDGTYSHNESSIVTLNRLGLIASAYTKIKTFEPGGHNEHGDWGPTQDDVLIYGYLGSVVITPLGEAFCRAVMPEAKDSA